eukprot:snap_masked-scaffold_27-processed-gene-4.18-mRNA-1 protein AED:1.00 eAED:1.00 QI:0/0/0/0/1/1/2/0/83
MVGMARSPLVVVGEEGTGLVFAPVVRQSVQEASSGFQLGYDFVGIGVLQVSLSIPPVLYPMFMSPALRMLAFFMCSSACIGLY